MGFDQLETLDNKDLLMNNQKSLYGTRALIKSYRPKIERSRLAFHCENEEPEYVQLQMQPRNANEVKKDLSLLNQKLKFFDLRHSIYSIKPTEYERQGSKKTLNYINTSENVN